MNMTLSIWIDRFRWLSDGLATRNPKLKRAHLVTNLHPNFEGMKMTHLAHLDVPAIPLVFIVIFLVTADNQVSLFHRSF
jgi:hypothetical protein